MRFCSSVLAVIAAAIVYFEGLSSSVPMRGLNEVLAVLCTSVSQVNIASTMYDKYSPDE